MASGNAGVTGIGTLAFIAATVTATGNIVAATNISAGGTISAALGISTAGSVTGTAAAGSATVGTTNLGYLGVPVNNISGSSYTIVLSDQGKTIYAPGGGTITIPANSVTAFPIGTGMSIIAAAAGTIQINSDTLIWAGPGSTGTRTLAANCMISIVKVATTTWYVAGAGLS